MNDNYLNFFSSIVNKSLGARFGLEPTLCHFCHRVFRVSEGQALIGLILSQAPSPEMTESTVVEEPYASHERINFGNLKKTTEINYEDQSIQFSTTLATNDFRKLPETTK